MTIAATAVILAFPFHVIVAHSTPQLAGLRIRYQV